MSGSVCSRGLSCQLPVGSVLGVSFAADRADVAGGTTSGGHGLLNGWRTRAPAKPDTARRTFTVGGPRTGPTSYEARPEPSAPAIHRCWHDGPQGARLGCIRSGVNWRAAAGAASRWLRSRPTSGPLWRCGSRQGCTARPDFVRGVPREPPGRRSSVLLDVLIGFGPPLAIAFLEHLPQHPPRLNVVILRLRLAHAFSVLRAARARKSNSRRSRRNHRRPPCSVNGTWPRDARPFKAISEQPSTAAANGASNHS